MEPESSMEFTSRLCRPMDNAAFWQKFSDDMTGDTIIQLLTECNKVVRTMTTNQDNQKQETNISVSEHLKHFMGEMNLDEINNCVMCKEVEKDLKINKALQSETGNLEEVKEDTLSSLNASYTSQNWKFVKLQKDAYDTLKTEGGGIHKDVRNYLLRTLEERHADCKGKGSYSHLVEFKDSAVAGETETCDDCKKSFEARKALNCISHGQPLPEDDRKYLSDILDDPSSCEHCKEILCCRRAYENILADNPLSDEERSLLLTIFPENVYCNRCSEIGSHKSIAEQDDFDKIVRVEVLEKHQECKMCQDTLLCMNAQQRISQEGYLSDDMREFVINSLQKAQDSWKCEKKSVNCLKIFMELDQLQNSDVQLSPNNQLHLLEKLNGESPCVDCQDQMFKSIKVALENKQTLVQEQVDCLRNIILKRACTGCDMLINQIKVRKTLVEKKVLSSNLQNMLCRILPCTSEYKDYQHCKTTLKNLSDNSALTEQDENWIKEISDATQNCKAEICQATHDEDFNLANISRKELMEVWNAGLNCVECHVRLLHTVTAVAEASETDMDKKVEVAYLKNYLKKHEQRMVCYVCEGFDVPNKPLILSQPSFEKMTTCGCSKSAEHLKDLKQDILEGILCYPSVVAVKTNKRNSRHKESKKKTKKHTQAGNTDMIAQTPDDVQQRGDAGEDRKDTQASNTDTVAQTPDDVCQEEKGMTGGGRQDTQASNTDTLAQTPDNVQQRGEAGHKAKNHTVGERQGIDDIVQVLTHWSKEHKVPLCILTNYKFQNVCRNFIDVKSVTHNNEEVDIMVFSRQLGVILIEVKGIQLKGSNMKKGLRMAKEQLERDERVFYEVNRDWVGDKYIPITSLIALPNIPCSNLTDIGLCSSDKRNIITECDLTQFKSNETNLDKFIGVPKNKMVIQDNDYIKLVERFYGLDHLCDAPYSLAKGIKAVGKAIFLTEYQSKIVKCRDNPYQALAGNYGTGKSLMLVLKAREIANDKMDNSEKASEKNVLMVSCTDVTIDGKFMHLQQPDDSMNHLKKLTGNEARESPSYFDHIAYFMLKDFIEKTPNVAEGVNLADTLSNAIQSRASKLPELHLFLDEIPLNFLKEFKTYIEKLIKANKSIKTLWFSVATHTFRVHVHNKQDPDWVQSECPEQFQFIYLRQNLRVPGNTLKLHKQFEITGGVGHVDTEKGDIEPGPKPLLYRVPPCVCKPVGRDVTCLTCTCSQSRMTESLKLLFIKLGMIDKDSLDVTKSDKWPGSVTMLLFAVTDSQFEADVSKLLIESCKNLKIEVEDKRECKPGTSQPWLNQKILLTTETAFIGCESYVLICVDLYAMLHCYKNSKLAFTTCAISRCMSQYVHLTWHREEAEQMFTKQMRTKMKSVESFVFKKDIDTALSQKPTSLEKFIEEGFITEEKVYYPCS